MVSVKLLIMHGAVLPELMGVAGLNSESADHAAFATPL
jgi:hypothetical protein